MVYKMLLQVAFLLVVGAQANIFDNIKTFQANFIQTIQNSSDKTIVYKGEVFIKGNARILWQYKKPIIKNVYINNSYAIVDEPELEQAIYTKLHQEVDILDIIKNAKEISPTLYRTTLYEIQYDIHVKQNQIESINYQDELENQVSIAFSNIKENLILPNDLFEFYPPTSYDIIRK
ncbi:LolA-like outer membrane lipoprotein chaperone [Candidatus Marinarcus aquaticus]|uniref:Cell envelope biogenesis protein LolA n=1 Tax=Candidatus Marinarcus aquaticus TaxID=2044504 RepID=A0A4Q0XRX9_9BACT|nr:LolA-like outer membrane lipoprotein chaperone [Candidatus Marinarcus aquaticus]RXJ60220.1 cell envelope biogenesis protein LolA [Candidatus Marinarcus aquaticus]